jgi:hypothetical protein
VFETWTLPSSRASNTPKATPVTWRPVVGGRDASGWDGMRRAPDDFGKIQMWILSALIP